MNPQHTVPVLDDNGTIVCESHAIVIYLASKYGKDSGLYPKDLVEQTKVNAALFFEGSMLFPRMRAIFVSFELNVFVCIRTCMHNLRFSLGTDFLQRWY